MIENNKYVDMDELVDELKKTISLPMNKIFNSGDNDREKTNSFAAVCLSLNEVIESVMGSTLTNMEDKKQKEAIRRVFIQVNEMMYGHLNFVLSRFKDEEITRKN